MSMKLSYTDSLVRNLYGFMAFKKQKKKKKKTHKDLREQNLTER